MRKKRLGIPSWAVWTGFCALAFAAGIMVASWAWVPDVSFLILDNPKYTAYMRIYVRKARAAGKKPVVVWHWVPLSEISPFLQKAVLVGEDDAFYHHGGVDWDALEKAMAYNRKKGRFARGGSTITEQVARNLFLSPARNPIRKFKEILIARRLESVLTKDRILEIYLNIAEWGRGIYGAQAASQLYFDKDAKDLSPDEAAALAAALPSPWRRNPKEGGKALETKKEIIIERMRKLGYIPPDVPLTDVDVAEDSPKPETPAVVARPPAPPSPPAAAVPSDNKSGAATGAIAVPCDTPAAPPPLLAPIVKSANPDKPAEESDSCGPQPPSLLH